MAKHFKPRSHSRIPVSCFLYYLGEGVVGTGKVCDLSVKGWRIEGDKPVSVGMRLTLRVFLPDEPKAIDIEGVIVQWVKDGAFGLENVGVNAASEARIKRFVDSMLKPPAPVASRSSPFDLSSHPVQSIVWMHSAMHALRSSSWPYFHQRSTKPFCHRYECRLNTPLSGTITLRHIFHILTGGC